MKPSYHANKKGFINAFVCALMAMILMISQLYIARYQTLLQLQNLKKSTFYCELYVFQHLQSEIEEKSQDDEIKDVDMEETPPSETEEMQPEEQREEHLFFQDCQIALTYQENDVLVEIQTPKDIQKMRIELDPDTKEIEDVGYES